jgi:hypothetical protein
MLKSGELEKFIEEKMKEIPEEKKPEKGLREG